MDRPEKGGEVADGCLLSEGPAENRGVCVKGTGGGANEGSEQAVLLGMESKVLRLGVLAALGLGDGVGLESPPLGDVTGLAMEGVVDCDVSNGWAVGPEELDVCMLVGVRVKQEVWVRKGRGRAFQWTPASAAISAQTSKTSS